MDSTIFTNEQHKVWRTLYANMTPRTARYACREWLEGFELLSLPEERIPSLDTLNQRITPRTGWWTKRTAIR